MNTHEETELILGNSNKKFSGVTSTMLQTLPHQQKQMKLVVLGDHHLPEETRSLSFMQAAKLCKTLLPSGKKRVFHARRNDEMIQAILLKKLFGAKITTAFTSTAQRHHSGFTKWLMSKMDGIITTCEAAGSYLETPADVMIPHGIDTQTYFPADDKQQAWNDLGLPGEFGIGIFGRVRHQKGVDVLIDAIIPILQSNPAPTVVIVGETTPSHQAFLDEQLAKCEVAGVKDRVVVLGKQPFSEIPKLFRAMSVVAALSRNEGYGLTVPEAMASGTAVIASEAGAWKEVVEEGVCGFTAPCGDVEATREKFNRLLSSECDLEAMGKAGQQRVLDLYTIEREASSLCAYYRKLQNAER